MISLMFPGLTEVEIRSVKYKDYFFRLLRLGYQDSNVGQTSYGSTVLNHYPHITLSGCYCALADGFRRYDIGLNWVANEIITPPLCLGKQFL